MFTAPGFRLSLSLLLVLILLSYLSIYLGRPPKAKPASAPLTEFSAERAMSYVRQIAREPHAIGTPGHARVKTYLLNTLKTLGLDPQVQEALVINPPGSPGSSVNSGTMLGVSSGSAYVYNVIARLKGSSPGKALLLMAHYDSQPNASGAGDDGSGVAAILETARAIQQGKQLKHDVIILFTDGEEYGLMGAKAFLKHPWAAEVGLVINLEARGTGGASMTFEMSPENGWIVEQFAKSVPYPVASSLAYEVYRSLPNDTDFTVFRKAGYSGVNSAFIDGFVHYHKLTDTPENLDKNSLQHHGDNMLALVQNVGNIPLDHLKAPDKVFFNWAGNELVHYPMKFDWFWMFLLSATLLAVFTLGLRQKALSVRQVLGGFGLYLICLIIICGFCLLVNMGVHRALPLTHFFNGSYGSSMFFVAYALLTIGAFGLLINLALRWILPLSLVFGAYLFVYSLTLAGFILLPATTYLFMFPLLSTSAGLLFVQWQTKGHAELRPVQIWILLISTLPALFIVMPLVKMLFVTFDLQLPVASVLLLVLVLALLLPLWILVEKGLRRKKKPVLPLVSLASGIIVMLVAIANEAPDARQPLHTQTSYFLNADTKQAVWASYYFMEPDEWNKQFFTKPTIGKLTEIYPDTLLTGPYQYLKNPATAITDAPPEAVILSDITSSVSRELTLELHSRRGAAHIEAVLFPEKAENVLAVELNDEPVEIKSQLTSAGPAFDIILFGLPESKRITLTVKLKPGNSLRIMLYDQSIGLPVKLIKIPRPAHVVPEQGRRSHLTVIGKAYQF